MKRHNKNVTIIGLFQLRKSSPFRFKWKSSLNQQERIKIYKVMKIRRCETCKLEKKKNNWLADGWILSFRSPCSDGGCQSFFKNVCPFGWFQFQEMKGSVVVCSDERLQLRDSRRYLKVVKKSQGEMTEDGYRGELRIRGRTCWSSSWWVTNARRSAAGVCSGAWSHVLADAGWTPAPPGLETRRLSTLCGSLWTSPPVCL